MELTTLLYYLWNYIFEQENTEHSIMNVMYIDIHDILNTRPGLLKVKPLK